MKLIMISFSSLAATAAALSLATAANFLIQLTTKKDGLGFSKVFVYGAYALALSRKTPILKLSRKAATLDVVGKMLKYLGTIVAIILSF